MLKRKDFQHVITLEDPDLIIQMGIWKNVCKNKMNQGKSLKRDMTIKLKNDKKFAY